MHVFKWIGLILLLLVGVGIGRFCATFARHRYAKSCAFLTLVKHIRTQISCFQRPIPEILANLDGELCSTCGYSAKHTTFLTMLEECEPFLPDEIYNILSGFGKVLGEGYREEQLRCCDDCIERLTPLCRQQAEELERRVKLAYLLPLAFAGALILMLI